MSKLCKGLIFRKKQKYSFDEYLDVVGEYADRQILKCENEEQIEFVCGNCEVKIVSEAPENLSFTVTLYFRRNDGQYIRKMSNRKIKISNFASGIENIVTGKKITYEITHPWRNVCGI